jgi:UDPglucose 6-dehydrogenase
MNVVVLGLWHLGCVTAACCAEHFFVVGLDFDETTVAGLREGRAPLFEPGLDLLLQQGLAAGRLQFGTGADEAALGCADLLWVCYDTPVDEKDVPDVKFVFERLERCLPYLRSEAVVLISSQVPAGTCRALESLHPGVSFAYSPENLRLGKALDSFRAPARIVAGTRASQGREVLARVFAPFCEHVVWMGSESAEMTKHAINAWLALSVTFANEIARLCEIVGADAREVEQGLRSEPRIGSKAYIRAGSAFAGGTLARDVVTLIRLASEHREHTELFPAVLASNESHKGWALRKLETLLAPLKEATVAVLGLTYKPETSTLRRSGAVELCAKLLTAGANVRCYDPTVSELPAELRGAQVCATLEEAVRCADAAVIATEWHQIKDAPWPALAQQMRRSVILDANRFLGLRDDQLAGVEYVAVGTPEAPRRT